jgi:hypothetical protein
MDKNYLNDRLFNFAVNTILFLQKIKNTPESRIIKYQLQNHLLQAEQTMKNHNQRHPGLIFQIK